MRNRSRAYRCTGDGEELALVLEGFLRQAEAEAREIRAEAAQEAQAQRSDATTQARDYVGRVSESTGVMLQRLNAMETELTSLVDGLRTVAAEARSLGLKIGLEPYQREGGEPWTIASSIPEAVQLIEEAGDPPALGIQFDAWHLWNTPTLEDDIERELGRFVGVHVSDSREPTRGWVRQSCTCVGNMSWRAAWSPPDPIIPTSSPYITTGAPRSR